MRVAAIDCGTNSVRLLVAEVYPDGFRDRTRQMEIVRLGEGVDRTGHLSDAALDRTRTVLVRYGDELRALGAGRVRMVATSATRDADNAADFRAMVRATIGVDPEVVSGDEEATLSFTGAVRGLPADASPPYLVVDIGGGSTEFVRGTSTVDAAVSVDIGCVRMTERHLRHDPPRPDEIAAAEKDITATVDSALSTVDGAMAGTLVGLAGSVTTVAAIALRLDRYDPARTHHARVPYARVADVTADLLAASTAQRRAIPVMHPGRADVIAAGALILRTVMARLGADAVVASEHDILDGIALSIAG